MIAESMALNGVSWTARGVCAKKRAIKLTRVNKNPHTVSVQPMNGMMRQITTATHKNGYATPNIGTVKRLVKKDRRLSFEYIKAKNGKIAMVALVETASDSATNFGKIFLKKAVKNGLRSMIPMTQK